MDFGDFLNLILLQQFEEHNERHRENLQRRMLRDTSNPFQIRDDIFLKYFRVSKDIAFYIINQVRQHLQSERSTAVAVELKVLTALTFYGHGSYQKCVGQNLHFAMHQSTVSRIIGEVSNTLVQFLLPEMVTFPKRNIEQNRIKERFYDKFGIPGVLGAIDCTHIAIVAPPTHDAVRPGIAYYNHKGYYSINVQMINICDSDLRILECNARFPGATHDSAIWSLSAVRTFLQQKYNENDLRSLWLIGDSGYPLEPWLLTPIREAQENTPEGRYNTVHIRARNCIERAFGVLKQRFRCLLQHRSLHYDPVKAGKIIYSCVVLHNMAIAHNIELPNDNEEPQNLPNADGIGHVEEAEQNLLLEGRRIRNELIRRYFIE